MSVEQIAIEFGQARLAKLAAKRKRNECHERCELVTVEENSDGFGMTITGTPCFKQFDQEFQEGLPQEDWCDACKESQGYHDEFVRQSRKAAGLLCSLLAVVRRKEDSDGSE